MKTSKKDQNSAENTFKKILRLDAQNPVANYRYAFLMYEERNWLAALQYFDRVVKVKNEDEPLSKDQRIKAHLFIGDCAVMLAQEAGEQANLLMANEDELGTEGITIEDSKEKMESQ